MNNIEKYKNLALITQIGIQSVVTILIGLFIGVKLDEKLKTNGIFTIVFLFIFSGAAILNIYKLAMKSSKKKDVEDGETNKKDTD